MRLIDTATKRLVWMVNPPPRYAILSHTWGDEEVLFEDFTRAGDIDPSTAHKKKGHAKFLGAVKLARKAGFQYVWIDNCCIDKSSSAELSEAINSMFKWYQRSTICFVYLSDYHDGQRRNTLGNCRWFGRSWTLQELIGPETVHFYSHEWKFIGAKDDQGFCRLLAKRTRIPTTVLSEPKSFQLASVAQRMSWAADREATREEDCSYSLFGIFEVNLVLLYGEGGKRAFRRLQEEIIRNNSDDSILVWEAVPGVDPDEGFHKEKTWTALAPSLACFRNAGDVIYKLPKWKAITEHMAVTPWGISMGVRVREASNKTWAILSSESLSTPDYFCIQICIAGRPGQLPSEVQVYRRTSPRLDLLPIKAKDLSENPRRKLQLITLA
ncbi:HET domain-containing protein [Microdochium nivale]|nr:HET domain-containing protein [Microdochium nivale]